MKVVYYDKETGQVEAVCVNCDTTSQKFTKLERVQVDDTTNVTRDHKWNGTRFVKSANPVQPRPEPARPTKQDFASATTLDEKIELIARAIGLSDSGGSA